MTSDPLTIIHGDALSSLRTLESESVQCVVTSPPYWSLRDYGIEPLVWDATVECEHEWTAGPTKEGFTSKARWQHVVNGDGDTGFPSSERGAEAWQHNPGAWGKVKQGDFCAKCGAWRGCLGLEPTPELYVSHIVQVFRELKRVLRDDGVLWLNLGDSYFASGQGFGDTKTTNKNHNGSRQRQKPQWHECGLKPKDLVGIPWRVAFALQADGWYLRSDIIWSKPNPKPESVTDRPTRSHEYIFLLSKSQRYYYDAEAIKEPAAPETLARVSQETLNTQTGGFKQEQYEQNLPGRKHRDRRPADILKHMGTTGVGVTTRNRRSVWTIPTAPFSEAHFATFPPDLVIPCVLAGSKPGDIVLDPFAGSGTVGKVAIGRGRKAILIEPNESYVEMIERRCRVNIGLPITA